MRASVRATVPACVHVCARVCLCVRVCECTCGVCAVSAHLQILVMALHACGSGMWLVPAWVAAFSFLFFSFFFGGGHFFFGGVSGAWLDNPSRGVWLDNPRCTRSTAHLSVGSPKLVEELEESRGESPERGLFPKLFQI